MILRTGKILDVMKMKNVTRLSKFQKEMEPANEIYTKELENFAKKYAGYNIHQRHCAA